MGYTVTNLEVIECFAVHFGDEHPVCQSMSLAVGLLGKKHFLYLQQQMAKMALFFAFKRFSDCVDYEMTVLNGSDLGGNKTGDSESILADQKILDR